MINLVRAAGYAAAAMVLTGVMTFADPTMAWVGEAAPVTAPYTDHAVATIEVAPLPAPETPTISPAAPAAEAAIQPAVLTEGFEQEAAQAKLRSLSQLVDEFHGTDTEDAEHDCLATAIYFESKGEPLHGQLAVAEVVINRAQSGRFPKSLCGVVKQPGQFSFVRGGRLPSLPRASADWKTAVAIARIARQDLADSAAEDALFFHARRVSPGWKKKRVATLGNHVFYR
jgi:spore germination cell wall hydrolase CwlJ-like protein